MHFDLLSRNNRVRGRGGRIPHSNIQRSFVKNESWFKVMVPFGAAMSKEDLFKLINENVEGKFDPIQVCDSLHCKMIS